MCDDHWVNVDETTSFIRVRCMYDFKDEKWIIYSGGIAVEDAITDIKYDNDNIRSVLE